ncbi:hypothetical protein KCM76_25010 [Zooshikella marina]|uniref:HEAT repeat domain-containing protein n=1 Tax=Zooshikella ganghwensis TaxID=202772 RepID=UPI001BAF760C|nr:HEAT repeat domain-containing protein [Zooshikella ganghwensis]MBU2709280.1 hypothetical protein [Zooshikella ganghwensis]
MAYSDIETLVEQLSNKSSAKRKSAAKKLRKLKSKDSGTALLAALKSELKDKRTWETQYQMIMALGESGYIESLGFMLELTEREFEATMVYLALGDAITRLTYLSENSIHKAIEYVTSKNYQPLLSDGVLRAVAMLKIIPEEDDINMLLNYADSSSTPENSKAWIVSASAGWHKNIRTVPFLQRQVSSKNQQIKKAAEAALKKKYVKWSIL